MSQQPIEKCDNCHKEFPQSKISTHFGYCRRNIKKCDTCGEMYDINFTEDHQEEFHKMNPCRHCKKQFKPNEVAKHQNICPSRTEFCQYCDLNVPLKNFNTHVKQCQARTKLCENCRKPIANKDFLAHPFSCPGFVQQIKPRRQQSQKPANNNYNDYIRNVQSKQTNDMRYESKPVIREIKYEYKGQDLRSKQKRTQPVYANIQNPPPVQQYIQKPVQPARQQSRETHSTKPVTGMTNKNYQHPGLNQNKYNGIGSGKGLNYAQRQKPNSNKFIQQNTKIVESKCEYIPATKPTIVYPANTQVREGSNKMIISPQTNIVRNSNQYGNSSSKPGQISTNNPNHNNNQPSLSNNNPISSLDNGKYALNYPKPKQQNIRKEIIPNRNQPIRKQADKFTKPVYKVEDRPQPQRIQARRVQPTTYISGRSNQVPASYQPPANSYQYQSPPKVSPYEQGIRDNFYPQTHLEDEDQELQRVLMMSLQNKSKQVNNGIINNYKPKIDQISPQLIQNDMLNESFYGNQKAIMQEIQRNQKRR